MTEFNKKDFGERLKNFRKNKGLSQENLAKVIGKNATTIGRFENGQLIPNAEQIFLMCNELEINEQDLFNIDTRIHFKESNNPFNTKTIYIYYNGFYPTRKKFDKCKFKINIHQKTNYSAIEMVDYKTNKIYLTGYIETDNCMAFLKFNNYKPTSPRLECSQINVNIGDGVNGIIRGVFFCTNGQYEPSCRKCFISTKDIEFTDEMLEDLKITDEELKKLQDINIWYPDITNKEDFEE